jgi:histidine triad (HIT) family protein
MWKSGRLEINSAHRPSFPEFHIFLMSKTIFQKIIDREIPAKIAHEDELCLAIHDVSPQAPVHVLIIPKKPIPRVGEASPADQAVLGHLLLTAAHLAKKLGVAESGYRLVINNGRDGGESVPHLHVHLLGQRPLAWPPG